MTKYLYLLLFSAAFGGACNINTQQKYSVEFEAVGELNLNASGFPLYYYIVKTDTAKLLVANYHKHPELVVYNYDNPKLVDTVPLGDNLMTFHFQSPDSIFVFYNPRSKPEFKHDSVLMRINMKGDTLDIYDFSQTPATCSKNPGSFPDSVFIVPDNYQRLKYSDNKIFLWFWQYNSQNPGDSSYYETDFPKGGHINTLTGEFVPHNGIEYPHFKPGNYYSNYYEDIYIEIGHNGNPLYSFGHTPTFFEYDLKTGQIREHYVKSSFVDTIIPSDDKSDVENRFLTQPQYRGIYYDKYNKRYMRAVQLPPDQYKKNNSLCVFFDTTFTVLGEGPVPAGSPFFTKNYYHTGAPSDESDDTVRFTRHTVNFKKIDESELMSVVTKAKAHKIKIYKGKIERYLRKEMQINDKNYIAVILPRLTCPSCVKTTLGFFEGSLEHLTSNSFYLVLASGDQKILNQRLNNTGITEKTKNVIIDEDETYLRYHDKSTFNARLVFVKDKKIIHDKIYSPVELTDMQIKILKHINPDANYEEVDQ